MNKDSLSPFKRLLIQSQALSQYRLSDEYKAQVNKNNQLLTIILRMQSEYLHFKR